MWESVCEGCGLEMKREQWGAQGCVGGAGGHRRARDRCRRARDRCRGAQDEYGKAQRVREGRKPRRVCERKQRGSSQQKVRVSVGLTSAMTAFCGNPRLVCDGNEV